MSNWKMRFGKVLAGYLRERMQISPTTDREVYELYLKMTDKDLRGIWVTISKILGISNKQAHDYFHNTWSKQFYHDITPHKRTLNEMLARVYNDATQDPKEVIKMITDEFKTKNPLVQLHPQSLYIYLYTQIKRYGEKILQNQSYDSDTVPSKYPKPPQISLPIITDQCSDIQEQYINHMVKILQQIDLSQ